MLEDFLQLARPRELSPKPVDLTALIGRVLDLLEKDAERRGAKLQRKLDPVPQVAGDDGRLRQVVMNLALNALEASGRAAASRSPPRRAMITLWCCTSTTPAPGVPKELRERIFEPFFTTKAQGSELGLLS
jgi:signal transduction histidine kinase